VGEAADGVREKQGEPMVKRMCALLAAAAAISAVTPAAAGAASTSNTKCNVVFLIPLC
jgi:hypothetical protein